MAVSAQYPAQGAFRPEALAAQLAARLPQTPPQMGGHDDYHLDSSAPLALGGVKAAVLVPLVAYREPVLLFTRRTENLARHSGQISFPGGRIEPGDVSPLAAALRETAEETGILPASVTPAGYLSRYLTGTGFDIQPVVGVLAPGFTLAPDPAEVASVFEVPLCFLRDPASCRRETREWNGRSRAFYAFTHEGHEIWGATAAILVDLMTRLAPAARHGDGS